MSRVVLRGARYVVTVDEADTVLQHATITIDDGTITSIEPAAREAEPTEAQPTPTEPTEAHPTTTRSRSTPAASS